MSVRSWHPRSRRGCVTCKKRHVKCDEARPICMRCVQSQKTCLGYKDFIDAGQPRPLKIKFVLYKAKSEAQQIPSTVSTNVFSSEQRQLAFFARVTIPLLADSFGGSIWRDADVEQLLLDSSFKDIALTFASHHMLFARRTSNDTAPTDDRRLLESYSKALSAAQDLMTRKATGSVTPIFASLLLLVLESLRGRDKALQKHLLGGLRLLKTNHYKLDHSKRLRLLQIYGGLALNSLMHSPDPDTHAELATMPWREIDLGQSVTSLSILGTLSDRVVVQTYSYILNYSSNTFSNIDEREAALETVKNSIDFVERGLQELTSSSPSSSSSSSSSSPPSPSTTTHSTSTSISSKTPTNAIASLIKARIILCKIFLDVCPTNAQSSYDNHIEAFRQIVDLVAQALRQHADQSLTNAEWPEVFSIGMGVMPLLRLIIQQCRHPQVRRDALKLLKLCPRKEGLWDSLDCRRVGEAIISFEESGLQLKLDSDEDGNDKGDVHGVYSTKIPIPEEKRIHFTRFERAPEQPTRKVLYILCRPVIGLSDKSFTIIPLE